MKKLLALALGIGLIGTLALTSSDVDAGGKTEDTINPRTFATLGACTVSSVGSTATITDGPSTPTWNMAATGGGITTSAVYCDGTSWKVYAGGGTGSTNTVVFAHMALPTGAGLFYTTANLMAEDSFTTTSLNTNLWNNNFGQSWFGRASNNGNYPAPYSGSNCSGGFCAQNRSYFDPYPYGFGTQRVAGQTPLQRLTDSTGNICGTEPQCLALTSQPSNGFGFGTTWSGGSLTTYTTGPATGTGTARVSPMRLGGCGTGGNTECYIQLRAKFPDCRYGNWSDIWFWADGPAGDSDHAVDEFDLHECGFQTNLSTTNFTVSSNNRMPGSGNVQKHTNVGVDITQAYHIYGLRYVPNTVTQSGLYAVYFDNQLIAAWSTNCDAGWDSVTAAMCHSTSPGINPPTNGTPVSFRDLSLVINQEVAQTDVPGHTQPDTVNHPGPFTYYFNDVQVYRK